MTSRWTATVLIIALIAPMAVFAQTVVGRSIVNSKVALLFADGTWAYEETGSAGATACKVISATVQFCGQSAGWIDTPSQSQEINAAFRIDARHYAQYIVEDLGTDDGLNAEFMRSAVLSNAKRTSGQDAEVIDVIAASLGDRSGETLVYRVRLNGVPIVFANSIFVGPKIAMQIMTYAIGSDYTPEQAKLQADLLGFTKVAP